MEAFAAAGAGFLLAVLWFDLMHDEMARGHDGDALPDPVIEGVTRYYAQVTRGASPMNRLVGLAMVGLVASLVTQIVAGHDPRWASVVSLPLALTGIVTAIARTVPTAVRLGQREFAEPAAASRAIRTIRTDHHVAFAAIAAVLVIQLVSAAL